MELSKFIHLRENVFSGDFCGVLIDTFKREDEKKGTYLGQMASGVNLNIKNTKEMNLFDHSDILDKFDFFPTMNQELSNHFLGNLAYRHYFDSSLRLFTESCKYETCQLQKYKKGEGHYGEWHVEVENLKSSNRIFSMIVYLNDVYEGGETEFLYSNTKIKPKTGSVVIFPSSFPFVHKGNKPLSNDKYIISTWLVYEPQ